MENSRNKSGIKLQTYHEAVILMQINACVFVERPYVCVSVCDTESVPLFPNKSSLCSAHGRMKRSLFSLRSHETSDSLSSEEHRSRESSLKNTNT